MNNSTNNSHLLNLTVDRQHKFQHLSHIRGPEMLAEQVFCRLGEHQGTATCVTYKQHSKAGLLYCLSRGGSRLSVDLQLVHLSWVQIMVCPERTDRVRKDCLCWVPCWCPYWLWPAFPLIASLLALDVSLAKEHNWEHEETCTYI